MRKRSSDEISALRLEQRGFTLIELLIVVVILGILGVILMSNIAHALRKAREGRTIAHLGTMRTAVNMHQAYYDTWPNQFTDGSVPGWGDQYVVSPMDNIIPNVPEAQVALLPDAFAVNKWVPGVWNDASLQAWAPGNTQGFYYERTNGTTKINNGELSTEGKIYWDY